MKHKHFYRVVPLARKTQDIHFACVECGNHIFVRRSIYNICLKVGAPMLWIDLRHKI